MGNGKGKGTGKGKSPLLPDVNEDDPFIGGFGEGLDVKREPNSGQAQQEPAFQQHRDHYDPGIASYLRRPRIAIGASSMRTIASRDGDVS